MSMLCVTCKVKSGVRKTINVSNEKGTFIYRHRICPLCGAKSVTVEASELYMTARIETAYKLACADTQREIEQLNVADAMRGTALPIPVTQDTNSQFGQPYRLDPNYSGPPRTLEEAQAMDAMYGADGIEELEGEGDAQDAGEEPRPYDPQTAHADEILNSILNRGNT